MEKEELLNWLNEVFNDYIISADILFGETWEIKHNCPDAVLDAIVDLYNKVAGKNAIRYKEER